MRGKCGCLLVGAPLTTLLAVDAVVTGDVVAMVPLTLAAVLLAIAWQFGEPDGPTWRPPASGEDIRYPFGSPKNRR